MISIPFVGKLRSKILEDNGFTLRIIKNCKIEDLAELDGFSPKIADRIQKYAKMVDKNYIVPKETIFEEFRCPECGAIVSEIEYKCHKCGHKFFPPPERYDNKIDELAKTIVGIYKEPANPELWRKGETILEEMDFRKKASDFRFKASTLELEMIREEEEKVGEETVEISQKFEHRNLRDLYKKGMTNGLVNGSGVHKIKVEKRRGLSALILSFIIIIPILMVALLTYGISPPIVIDGKFGDWNNVPSLNIVSSYFTDFKIKNYDGYNYIYIASHGFFVNSSFQYFAILVDKDGNKNTGFPVNQLGVDYILMIYGTRGNLTKNFVKFDNNAWVKSGNFDVGMNSRHIEIKSMNFGKESRFLLYYKDGIEHYSSILTLKPTLTIEYSGGKVISSGGTEIEKIVMWNSYRGKIEINKMNILNMGNSSARIELKWGDNERAINIGIKNKTLDLNTPVIVDKNTIIDIIYLSGGSKYGTLKFKIYTDYPQIEIDRATGSYISSIPEKKSIDGIFLDWQDAKRDSRGKLPQNIDLKSYGISGENQIKVYLNVYGMLYGVGVPEIKISGGNASGGNGTKIKNLPEDTIEIYVDEDKNINTGFKIGNVGAEYRILLFGKQGVVSKDKSYKWEGKWVNYSIGLEKAKDYDSIEIGLNLQGNVYFRLVNFQGLWDRFSSLKSLKLQNISKNSKNISVNGSISSKTTTSKFNPRFVGKYNATELRAVFGTDVQVTTSSKDESKPTITRTSDGTLWVTYDYAYSSTDHDIYFANSTDDGSTWNVYYLDATTYNTSNSIIISDSSDNVYIFFENHTSNSYFKYYKHPLNAGSTWTIVSISSWTGWDKVYNLSAATYTVSSSIYIYVFFDYANSSAEYNVGRAKTWDSGSHWDAANIASTTDWEGHPSTTISTGTNPEVFVAYDHYDGNYWNITVLNNTDINSTSWSGYVFYWSGHDLTYPSVYGTGDDIYLVGEGAYSSTNHDIGLFNTTDNGLNWKWGSWVNSTSDDEVYPSVIANGADVYVFYLDATTGRICEKESTDYGQTWGNVNLVSDQGSGVSIYRTVSSYYYNGNLYVVWTDNRNGNDDIYFDKVPEMNMNILLIIPVILLIPIIWRKRNKY